VRDMAERVWRTPVDCIQARNFPRCFCIPIKFVGFMIYIVAVVDDVVFPCGRNWSGFDDLW